MAKQLPKNTVELLYIGLMSRWTTTAPSDRHAGLLDGNRAINSQTARMAFILRKIAAGNENQVYQTLAVGTRRNDGMSYVSKDPSWMISPHPLNDGWHLEGCVNLDQKLSFLQNLSKLNLSPALIECIEDFVAGRNIAKHIPTDEEQQVIFERCIANDLHKE